MKNNLNEKQIEAIKLIDSPLRIIAGAGSGKTTVITEKIKYIKEYYNCLYKNILALTFTKKAAGEMASRVFDNCNIEENNITTFHGFCFKVLKIDGDKVGLKKDFEIIDTYSQSKYIKAIVDDVYESKKAGYLRKVFSEIKNEKFDVSGIEGDLSFLSGFENLEVSLFNKYQKILRKNNKLDYDDLQLFVYLLFRKNEEIRKKWSSYFKYIFIDEFQDTNYLQFELVKQLLDNRNCLTIVGDPDQTIYSWRGAKQEIILNFERSFPNGKTIVLDKNYRSTQKILELANLIINNNEERYKKNLIPTKLIGENVSLKGFKTSEEEAEYIASDIKKIVDGQNIKFKDIFILTRSNKQIKNIEKYLNYYGVPYMIKGSDSFFNIKIIKDIMMFLKMYTFRDDVSTFACIEQLSKIGPISLKKIQQFVSNNSLDVYDWLIKGDNLDGMPKSLIDFSLCLKECEDMKDDFLEMSKLLSYILEKTGIEQKLKSNKSSYPEYEKIQSLYLILNEFDKNNSELCLLDTLSEYLLNVTFANDFDIESENKNRVLVSTIHGAKGMETPIVYIYDVNSYNFPADFNKEKDYIEEERRALYVALTRAKEKLTIVYDRSNLSSFIREIGQKTGTSSVFSSEGDGNFHTDIKIRESNEKLKQTGLKFGDIITHILFGEGIVIDVLETNFKVSFTDKKYGIKIINIASSAWSKK